MDNLDDLSKNQDSIISNNYFRFIQNFNQQKNNTRKITCKEKDFDIINNHPNYSLFSWYVAYNLYEPAGVVLLISTSLPSPSL